MGDADHQGGMRGAPGGAVVLAAVVLSGAGTRAPAPPSGFTGPTMRPEAVRCESLTGEVEAGETFERAFGDGLLFRLAPNRNAPPNPPGWTIEVRAAPDGEHDFVWAATPPYHFDNPRYLDTSYGRSAAEAVARDVRTFGFATSEADHEVLAEAAGFLASSRPPDMSPRAHEAARDSLRALWSTAMDSVGRGELRITDATVSDPETHPPGGRIERLAFEVKLCPEGGDPSQARRSAAQERDRDLPGTGRRVAGAPALAWDSLSAGCLELGWPEPRGALSDSLASVACRVEDAGRLARSGRVAWRWALYRRVLVYVATAETAERSLPLLPDTLREDELVLFAGPPDGARTRPVWHDRTDARLELLRPPRAMSLGDSARNGRPSVLFVHRRCYAGTGGCQDRPFRLTAAGGVEVLEPSYLEALAEALPEERGTWKGVFIETGGPAAEAPVYLPGDANAEPTFRARAPLRVEGGRAVADTVVVTPDAGSRSWLVHPAEGRFGPVDGETSEAGLRQRVGDSAVERADVFLAEGRCTPGARVFPGTPWTFEVAWADSARSRPAFARVVREGAMSGASPPVGDPGPRPFHTPEGVRLGTPLRDLEAVAGEPVRFAGFGWDFGGSLTWTAEGGELFLRLAYDPERLRAARSGPDSARVGALFGDRRVGSDHPLARRLGIRVASMRLDWRPPETDRFCG